jgi:addiction module HigA family antidote
MEQPMLKFNPPIHPGEILREEFLAPLGLSAGALAKALGVPRTRIERIVKEQMGISADTALRLAKYFDTTPNVWLNLQTGYDLAIEAEALKGPLAAIEARVHGNDNEPHGSRRARA